MGFQDHNHGQVGGVDEAQDSNRNGFPDFLGKQAVVQNPSPAPLNHLPSNKQT